MLLGVLKGLIHRAHVLCDRKEDLLEELSLLKDVFICNGYPETLVLKTLNESWPKETLKAVLKGVKQEVEGENSKGYFEVLHAPYVKGLSVPCVIVGCKNVVFSVPCGDCGIRYIGETGQHFSERRSQHQRDVKNRKKTNGFYCHIRENKGHKINWDKALYLDYEKNWKRRKIKEAIYINAINPTNTMSKKDILNLEKGYELDAVWSEFNEVHRQGIAKKIG